MQKLSKESIIAAYNDILTERAGKLIGERVFARETGISHHYWKGGYWRSWSTFGLMLDTRRIVQPNGSQMKHSYIVSQI